jgi:hypothetical protein
LNIRKQDIGRVSATTSVITQNYRRVSVIIDVITQGYNNYGRLRTRSDPSNSEPLTIKDS